MKDPLEDKKFDSFLVSEEQTKEYKKLFDEGYMETLYEGLGIPKDLYCNAELKPSIEEVLEKILDEYQLVYHVKTTPEVKENDTIEIHKIITRNL